jgi:hypothetical protein
VIIIYFIISIPLLGVYLKKAKLFGSEFTFRESIEKVDKYIKDTRKVSAIDNEMSEVYFHETFDLDSVYEVLEIDHVLAMAGLRIEIEKKIRLLAKNWFENVEREPLRRILQILKDRVILVDEQILALLEIVNICNRAVHGEMISYNEAKEIIDLTEQMNGSLSNGYSFNLLPNENFEEQGYCCEFEHCIENMPFQDDPNSDLACPTFGHTCPGGLSFVERCRQKAN